MSKNIGIVCEGPTDYIILKGIVDQITGEDNQYIQLQPEDDLTGEYGNGWKGVWKWCTDHVGILEKFMKDIEPQLDMIIVQMDGDVARKEKEVHCQCGTTVCESKGKVNPLECMRLKSSDCPIELPCMSHEVSVEGYIGHLTTLIASWLNQKNGICIVIPCDSTDPWANIISKGKAYHGIRIPGHKKRLLVYRQFVAKVCNSWEEVKNLCISAARFEEEIKTMNCSTGK